MRPCLPRLVAPVAIPLSHGGSYASTPTAPRSAWSSNRSMVFFDCLLLGPRRCAAKSSSSWRCCGTAPCARRSRSSTISMWPPCTPTSSCRTACRCVCLRGVFACVPCSALYCTVVRPFLVRFGLVLFRDRGCRLSAGACNKWQRDAFSVFFSLDPPPFERPPPPPLRTPLFFQCVSRGRSSTKPCAPRATSTRRATTASERSLGSGGEFSTAPPPPGTRSFVTVSAAVPCVPRAQKTFVVDGSCSPAMKFTLRSARPAAAAPVRPMRACARGSHREVTPFPAAATAATTISIAIAITTATSSLAFPSAGCGVPLLASSRSALCFDFYGQRGHDPGVQDGVPERQDAAHLRERGREAVRGA